MCDQSWFYISLIIVNDADVLIELLDEILISLVEYLYSWLVNIYIDHGRDALR